MKTGERGYALILVLILMALGTLMVIPSLQLAFASLRAKQINTSVFTEQYARDGAAEYAVWKLIYGDVTGLLTEGNPEENYTVTLNGIVVDLIIKIRTELGNSGVAGAEDNRVRMTETVECEITPLSTAFDDPCLPSVPTDPGLPNSAGMRARYTISLKQISPDLSVGVVAVYNEPANGFQITQVGGIPTNVDTPDGSFPEILAAIPTCLRSGGQTTTCGTNELVIRWALAAPVYFTQGQVKTFRFIATINQSNGNYCNRSYVKFTAAPPPYEHSGPTAKIKVGSPPNEGCVNGGMLLTKFVNAKVAQPGQTTIFTYMITIENLNNNTLQITQVKDVLPQQGFRYCSASFPPDDFPAQSCVQAKYKVTNTPFNPLTDSFTDTGYTNLLEPPQRTCLSGAPIPCAVADRWQLVWLGAAPWQSLAANGQAGDTLIIRLQSQFTPTESGSYYNEFFVDTSTCNAPNVFRPSGENVITNAEYCAAYSWPSGGTLVPAYDVRADAGNTTGQGNVALGDGTGSLDSWTVVD